MNTLRAAGWGRGWSVAAGVAAMALMTAAHAGAVFEDDFEGASRPEWSSSMRNNSHVGVFSHFLGRLGNERAELTLTGLEAGASYAMLLDLYVLDSWDGSNSPGPDTFRVLVDGVAALDRTISQFGGTQTWTIPPDAKGQLGFSGWEDSIFRRVPVTFTASASTVVLGFEGANLQDINDESWGIDNVVVWKVSDLAAQGFVTSTLPAEGEARAMAVDLFELDSLVVLDEATATDPGQHEMRGAGPNRTFGDGDDVVMALEASRLGNGRGLRLRVASGALPSGLWRYRSGSGIRDVDGNAVGVLTRGFEVLAPAPVFEDTFEGRNRPEWSSTPRDGAYPAVFSRFLGRLANGRAELTLSRLTAGASYTVLLDLYVIDSWDGNGFGPDTFRVLVDGVAALDRTISQFGGTQTWTIPPDVKGQLGFSSWEDSIFRRVPVTFTASASTVVLGFEGANLESLDNESWGIDNVAVWRTSDLAARGFVGTTLPGEGTSSSMALDRFEVWAAADLDPATSTSSAVHEMRGAGPNRMFGDGDDVVMALQVSGTGAPGRLRVLMPGGPLQPGLWRYRTLPGLLTVGGAEVAPFTRTFEVVNPVLGSIEGPENGVLVGAGPVPVDESPAGLGTFLGYGLGTFFAAGDVDYWRFDAEAGDRVTVTLEATDRPGIYPWLQLRTAADGVISQAQGGYWEGRSRLEGVVLSSPGTYYLRVWSDHGASGYRLRVERARSWQGEAWPATPVAFRNEGGNVLGRVAGHLEASGGDDLLQLGVLGAGTTVRVETAFPGGSDLSVAGPTLTLEDGAGVAVESAAGGALSRLVSSSGSYRLRVSSGSPGFRAAYVVTVYLVDATAPVVVSTTLPAEGSATSELVHGWTVDWSEELDPATARNGSNHELRRSLNDVFGDGEDVVIPVVATYGSGVQVAISVEGPLQPGRYRFTTGTGVRDRSGNGLASPVVREFEVVGMAGFVTETTLNNTAAQATPMGPGGAGLVEGPPGLWTVLGRGRLSDASDVDYYGFAALAGDALVVGVETVGNPTSSQLYYRVDGPTGSYVTDFYATSVNGWGQRGPMTVSRDGLHTLRVSRNYDYFGEYRFRLNLLRGGLQSEGDTRLNDAPGTASGVAYALVGGLLQARVAGAISTGDGPDHFRLGDLTEGTTVRLSLDLAPGSTLAGRLAIVLADGSVVAASAAGEAILEFQVPAGGGSYGARVTADSGAGLMAQYVLAISMGDERPPSVSSVSLPSEGSTTTALLSAFTVTFDEEMDPATVNGGAHVEVRSSVNDVFGDADDVVYAAAGSGYAGGQSATFVIPDGPLQPGRYRVTLGTGLRDRAGNALATAVTRTFAIVPVPGFVSENRSNNTASTATALGSEGGWDGSWRASAAMGVGSSPYDIATADLDGDGNADLVTANINSGNASILYGNGDGTFGAAVSLPCDSGPIGVAVGDVNGDGQTDVAVVNHYSSRASIHLGRGARAWAAPTSVTTGTNPRNVRMADLDGDGRMEVLVANQSSTFVTVLKANDTGGFARTDVAVGFGTWSVAVGDLDGDGQKDAVAVGAAGAAVLKGGPGGLVLQAFRAFGGEPADVALADIDGDGDPDAVVLNRPGRSLAILRNGPTGLAGSPEVIGGLGSDPYHLVVDDLDLDGDLDVAVAVYGSNQWARFMNQGGGRFGAPVASSASGNPIGIVAGDWNEDGARDLATANYNSGNVTAWLGNRGSFLAEAPSGLLSGLARGRLADTSDVDFYRFSARAGDVLTVAMETEGNAPASQLYYRVDGPSGEYITDFYASSYNGWGQSSPVTLPVDGSYTVYARYNYDYRGEYRLRVSLARGGMQVERESNNSAGSANEIVLSPVGGRATGRIAGYFRQDEAMAGDFYRVASVGEGQALDVSWAPVTAGTVSASMVVRGPSGDVVASGDATTGLRVVPTAGNGGVHTVQVVPMPPRRTEAARTNLLFQGGTRVRVPLNVPEDGMTVSFWFLSSSPDSGLFEVGNNGNDRHVYLSGGNIFARLYNHEVIRSSGLNLGDGRWHHVAYQYGTSIGGQRLFVDGVRVATGSKATSDFTWQTDVAFGYSYDGGYLRGSMEDVSIWNSALPEDRVLGLRTTAITGTEEGLIGFWPLNEGSGTGVSALAGLLPGTISGPVSWGVGLPAASWVGIQTGYVLTASVEDAVAPQVTGVDVAAEGGTSTALVNGLAVTFSEDMDAATVNAPGHFELRAAVNGVFGDGDDVVYGLVSAGYVSGMTAQIRVQGGPLQPGAYRFTAGTGLRDRAGNPLPAPFVRTFTVGSLDLFVSENRANDVAALGTTIGMPGDVERRLFRAGELSSPYGQHELAVGDIDGDGIDDLAVASNRQSLARVFLGVGDGTFRAPLDVAIGGWATGVQVGDVDGDGRMDLVLANIGDHGVTVVRQVGPMTFGLPVFIPAGQTPLVTRLADLDADGLPEIIVANRNSYFLTVLRRNGDGTYARTDIPSDGRPGMVAVGDVDGDGRVDVVASNWWDGSVSVYRNNSAGGLLPPVSRPVASEPRGIALGDLTGDGRLDIVVVQNGNQSVGVLAGLGDGTFEAPAQYAGAGADPWFLALDDLDADGRPDVMVGAYGSNRLVLYFNEVGGALGEPVALAGKNNPIGVVAGDWNRDGVRDVATANHHGDVTVWLGTRRLDVAENPAGLTSILVRGAMEKSQDEDWFRFSATAGDVLQLNTETAGNPAGSQLYVEVFAPSGARLLEAYSSWNGSLTTDPVTLSEEGVYALRVRIPWWWGYNYPGEYRAWIGLGRGGLAFERDSGQANTLASASPVSFVVSDGVRQARIAGHVATVDGGDVFRLGDLGAGTTVRASLDLPSDSGLIAALELLDAAGTVVHGTDAGAALAQDVAVAGAHFLRVRPLSGQGLAGRYVLNVSFSDRVPPFVVSTTLPAEGGFTDSLLDAFDVRFSEDMAAATVNNVGNVEVRVSANDVFGDDDDQVFPASSPGYVSGADVRYGLPGGPLVQGNVRVTLRTGFEDVNGNALAAPFVRRFEIRARPAFVREGGANDVRTGATRLGTSPAALFDGSFLVTGTVSAGSQPYDVAGADLDGDGVQDMVVANYGAGNVNVYRGQGDGTFQAPVAYPTGSGPYSLLVTDITGDGRQDILTVNYGGGSVTLWAGVGDGTFTSPLTWPVPNNPIGIAVGDVDGDGDLDAVVTRHTANAVAVVLRTGTTGIAAGPSIPTPAGPALVRLARVDADAHLDMVVSHYNAASIGVYRGNGSGGFAAPTVLATPHRPHTLEVVDLDADGSMDVVVANEGAASLSVFKGNGDGTFGPRVDLPSGNNPYVRAVDLDGDERPELVSGHYGSGTVGLWRNRGDGTFAAMASLASGLPGPTRVAAADWNGDGVLDLASANYNGGNVSIFLGNGIQALAVDPAGNGLRSAAAYGRLNGSGDVDWWSFGARAGDKIVLATENPGRPGASALYFRVMASNGDTLLNLYPDYYGTGQSPVIHIPADGTYFVLVTRWYDYFSEYQFRLVVAPPGASPEAESNNGIASATPLLLAPSGDGRSGVGVGHVHSVGDLDYFDLGTVEAGQTVFLNVRLQSGATFQPVVGVYDAANGYRVEASGGRGFDGVAEVDVATTGRYYAVVRASGSQGGLLQAYVLEALIVPTSTVGLPNLQVTSVVTPAGPRRSGDDVTVEFRVANVGRQPTGASAWSDRVVLSTNLTLGDLDDVQLGVVGHSGALAAGESYSVSRSLRIPDGVSGDFYVLVQADSANAVTEFVLENDNVTPSPEAIRVNRADYPDLVVEALAVTKDATIRAAWNIANRGTGPAPAGWRESVALRDLATGLVAWREERVLPSVMAPGTLTERSFAPPWPAPGRYRFEVSVDVGDDVYEFNDASHASAEGNNVASGTVDVERDLAVANLRIEPAGILRAGAPIVVRWDTVASGDVPPSGPWVDRVRVVNRTTGSVLLDVTTTSREAALTLPALGAGVGQIEATVTADAAQAIPEFDLALDAEANNSAFVIRESEPAPHPDLAAAVGDVPAAADAGQPLTVSWSISNVGNAPVGVAWRDDVYLSPGTGLEGARLVGSFLNDASSPSGGALAAGASIASSAAFAVPADLSGALRVVVVTDAAGVLTEPNKLNNRATSTGTILVRKPNLVPSAVVAPAVADAGETVEVRWTVTNAGNGATFSGWRATVGLSASADGAGAVAIGSIDRSETLAAGGVVEQSATVSIPAGFAGNRFVVVNLDTASQVPESNEADNAAVSAAAVGLRAPNLVAVDVAGPASAAPGNPFAIRWTARNTGSATATAPWSDRVYLSSDAAWGGDVSLASIAASDSLPAGASREVTGSVVVPVDGPAGNLYVLVATDAGNAVAESNESDNVGVSAIVVTVPLTLTVTGGAASVAENGSALTYTVTRNGDRSAALPVTLASSASTALSVPAGVTIPAGQSSATFAATPVADGVMAGDRAATLTVGATGFADVARQVTVTDVDVPRLSLALDASEMGEGASVPARVTRDPVTATPLVVTLVSTAPGQFLLPASVTITAGEASVAFAVLTLDDALVEADTPTTLTVTATGHTGASRPLTVLDDDTFTLGLSLAATTFPENAGAAATVGTVTRAPVTSQAITVALTSSDPAAATVPASVTIPAGQASATFNVSAVNDGIVDGSQVTDISASASLAGRPAVVAAPVTATVTDDDGPMLTLTLGASAAREGASPATLGTVRRNTSTATALVVSLASDNTAEATVPGTVEIPAGSAEATFPVATVADGVTDGSKAARITASAAGHESSTASLTVTDADLPDLVVAWVESPGVVETETITSARFRVENRGNAAATGPFIVRLYTSVDAVAGGDTYAAQYTFAGTLPAGAHFELRQGFTAPRRVGPVYLVAEVDPVRAVTELADDNNAAVSAAVMDVRAAYTAVASTDVSVAMAGTPVPIRGTVTRGDGTPGVGASVTVHVAVRGTRRTLGAIADGLGTFAVTFNPLPGEAGNYEIAAAHPGVSDPAAQDGFTLVGIRIDTAGALRVIEGQSAASGTRVQNLSDVPVNGLTVETTEVPPGLTVTPSLGSTTLAGNGSVDVAYGVAVADGTTTGGMVRFRVSGSGGITGTFEVPVIVEALRPNLVAIPGSLERGMRRGAQTTVQFDLVNRGGRPTGPLKLLVPPLSWMRVAAGGDVDNLLPGETNPVTVVLTPPATLPLGPYNGSFYVQAEQVGLNVPFAFRAMSEAQGTLRIEAVDEFTYYAEGEPRVAGATVVVSDAVTGAEVARRTTGANGIAEFVDLREDYYRVEVTADGHGSFRATQLVEAGRTTDVTAFLPRQTVRYRWTVEPIQVEDRTRITIETVFETAVPVPVVTMEPSVVDLADVAGDETQVDLTITNHGLIAARSSRFAMPSHPGWEFIPLITEVGDIPAKSSLTIPMTVRRLGGAGGGALVGVRRAARTAGTGGPCVVGGGLIWELPCGPRTNAYTVPITFNNAGADCGGTGGGWTGGGWGGGFGGGGGGGGGGGPTSVFNPPDISMPELCDCRYIPRICLDGGFEFDLSGRLESLVSAVLSKLPGARLTEAEMKVSFSGDICTCCVDGKISWEGKATGNGSIKAQVELGPGIAAELPFEAPPPWKDVSLDGRALAGVRLTLTGSIEGTYEKKCNEPPTLCIQGNAHLQAFAGAEFEGNASATLDLSPEGLGFGDVGFTGHVGGQIGLEGNIGATFNWCRGSGGSITACGNLVARANIGGSLEATLPDGTKINRGITLSADKVLAGGECDAAGDRLVAAPAAGGRRARVAGAFDGPFTESLPGDLFPLPTAEIAKALNLDRPPDAVCARVKLKLEQEAVLTRDAFRAMLEIENADVSALSDIEVSLRFRDAGSVDAAERFGVRPPEVTAMGAVDGTGTLAAHTTGKATWVLIPTRDAAGSEPRVYRVGGTLRYRQNGVLVTVPLADVPITVHPQPLLTLQYFHQRDVYSDDPFTPAVEPSIPYALGVMVRNDGFGQARNFRITSAQPQIVENERGLLIDFQLIGTQVAGDEVSPSLTANFGAINAGDIKVARWLFTSSLQGLFIDYSAKFEHIDSLGNPRLSLIDAVSIHETIRQVEAQGARADGKPDFLVNDVPDVRDLPDTLYLSQGGTNHVEVVEFASLDSIPSGSDTVVELTATMPAGWVYLRVPEPSDGSMQLTRIVRSDGRELPVDRTWWVTDRTFEGMGRRPTRENILHLLDDDSTGRYTLHYNTPAGEDHVAPSSAVGVLPAQSPRDIGLAWSGTDDASGVAGFDVYVSRNSGPYELWLEGTTLRGALYRGDLGATYRFYSVAFDRSGNREAAPATADATTAVAFESRGPVVGVIADVGMEPSTTYTGLPYSVTDPDTPLDLLGVTFVSSNASLLPVEGIVSVGTGPARTLSLTPVPGQYGTADVTMRVSDGTETAVRLFQVTVYRPNLAPLAVDDAVSVTRATSVRIPVATLLGNDSDPDGDTVVVDSVAPFSAAGGRVQLRGLFVVYTPPVGGPATDSFVYTAGDGFRGLTTATVQVTLTDPEPPEGSALSLSSMQATPQAVVLNFVGIKGRRYRIERSSNMQPPWTALGTATADDFGRFRFEDTTPLAPMGFYRIVRVTGP